eukprot:1193047-Prorocentrum_minimum.AAC.2
MEDRQRSDGSALIQIKVPGSHIPVDVSSPNHGGSGFRVVGSAKERFFKAPNRFGFADLALIRKTKSGRNLF